jgi:hypothetical protein
MSWEVGGFLGVKTAGGSAAALALPAAERHLILVGQELPLCPNFNPPANTFHARVRNTANPPGVPPIRREPDSPAHIATSARNFRHRATGDEIHPPEITRYLDAFWQSGLSRNQSSVRPRISNRAARKTNANDRASANNHSPARPWRCVARCPARLVELMSPPASVHASRYRW